MQSDPKPRRLKALLGKIEESLRGERRSLQTDKGDGITGLQRA
jgi:hypothetical protein